MKYLTHTICLLLIISSSFYAQSIKNIEYKVSKGETITQIAKKFNTTPKEIYKLNPDAQKGVTENTLLIIPSTTINKKNKTVTEIKKHEVKAKESLYAISRLYNISVETIENANPEIVNGNLQPGQILIIPSKNIVSKKETSTVTVKSDLVDENIIHEVLAKETKYAIAKQYNTTIEALEKLNPDLGKQELAIGYKLIVGTKKVPKDLKKDTPKTIIAKPDIIVLESIKPAETASYVIKSKETLYSISNQFNITQEQLITLNPELKDSVMEGMTIEVPNKPIITPTISRDYKDLAKTFKSTGNKKLALLLPFNLNKIEKDTINSTKTLLKKDKFLNMTLDFYAGALMAIDSVKKMGMNVEVKIYDSNETKSTSNVANLIQNNNLKAMDAIIGPFYQNNVENTAEILSSSNVPVISPLSKDFDKVYPNLFQTMPSNEAVKNAMLDFMRAKNGNIVAIIDPKKMAIKQFLADNHKDVILVQFTETGSLNTDNLKSLLVKDKTNYVIMETEKTNLILSITNVLQNLSKDYPIKLVILQDNEALDYEEINMSRLTKLNMHYPSIARPNNSPEATFFENNFRKKNKILPNQFATRGFDVTFDVLMRLSQDKPFIETITGDASEQIENRFNYVPNPTGGYLNKGVHILYYDTDLTIKEAK
jgi:LysM repeat protein